jgi:glutamyl-tRNA synthetase
MSASPAALPVRHVVRAAPSPTGDPHVGTAYISLFDWCVAKTTGGRFILRIEDTDRTRYVATSEARIFEALRWLGLGWDEGPDVGGPNGPYRQSERTAIYRAHVDTLLTNGAAYRCFCTEKRLEELRATQRAMKVPSGYDGLCRRLAPEKVAEKLAAGLPFTVRLAVPKEGSTSFHDDLRGDVTFENKGLDDQVLLKSDGFPTYHLANVVDDRLMGVTWVIRAEEWITSTPKHVLLYRAFGWPEPRWMHMPLLRNADKSKISKRKNPTSLTWFRDQGYLAEALVNFLALMGYSHSAGKEIFGLDEMLADFDPKRVTTSGPVFDLEKLTWLNGEWIRRLEPDVLAARIVEQLHRPAPIPFRPEGTDAPPPAPGPDAVRAWLGRDASRAAALPALVRRTIPLVRERLRTLEDYVSIASCFFHDGPPSVVAEDLVPKKRTPDEAKTALHAVRGELVTLEPFRAASIDAALRGLADRLGWKVGDLFLPIRVAVTGSKVSPPLFETIELLGRGETLARLDAVLER